MAEPAQASDDGRSTAVDGGMAAGIVVWVLLVAAFVLFVGFGSVPLHYNLKIGDLTSAHQGPVARTAYLRPRSQRILHVWLDQADRLPHSAHPALLRGLYFVGLPLLVVVAAGALWLALLAVGRVNSAPAVPAPANANGLDDGVRAPMVEPAAEPVDGQVVAAPRPDEPA